MSRYLSVAGQIGSGIMYKGDTTANCNSLGVGIYRITQLDGYIDLNYPAFNGYVVSLVVSGNGLQIFFFGDDSVVYYRHRWNLWAPWKKISFNP